MKRGVFLILNVLLILVNSIIVSATIDVTYKFGDASGFITNVDYMFYKCTNTCSPSELEGITPDSGNSGSNSYYLKQYPLEGTYAYFLYKGCLYPISQKANINNILNGAQKTITLSQKSPCSSSITSISISGSNKINEALTISTGVKSAFEKGTSPPTDFVPLTKENYYKSTVKVTLLIDNQEIETKTEDILISTTKQVSFTWIPTQVKSYEIKIKTDVDDCQCSTSSLEFSNSQYITINPSTLTQACTSSDWSCSTWSICTNSQQARTCTKTTSCEGETGKPAETQTCTTSENCPDSSTTCPKDAYTKCPSGHKACDCGTFNGNICQTNKICSGKIYLYSGTNTGGTCCSTQCTEKKEICITEGKTELCPPDLNGCAMSKTCKSGYWTDCARMDIGCVKAPSCLDGTPSGRCSNQSIGKFCFDGALSNHAICLTTPCTENWYCETFSSPCIAGYKICVSGYIDINKCNTTINKPITQQPCAYQNSATEEEFKLKLKSTEGDVESSRGEEGSAIGSTSTQSALNKLLSIPKNFNLTIGFETPFVLLLISLFFITIAVYYMSKRQKLPKIKEKPKNIKKEETHSVKVNDLLLSVVESLEGDERRVVDKLIEVEGTRIDKLREILGMNKTKLEIALSKLEKRQIIKERTDDNSKLFFNDWLK